MPAVDDLTMQSTSDQRMPRESEAETLRAVIPSEVGVTSDVSAGAAQIRTSPASPKKDGFGHEKPHEGQTNDWITPKGIIDALGHFDLDPCESDNQPWLCAARGYRLGRGEDGLKLPWNGSVYLNPPYGPHVDEWAIRLAGHGDGVLLIFLRSETQAWQRIFATGDGYLMLATRVCFRLPNGQKAKSGTAPSCLVAYGARNVERLRTCGLAGAFFRRAEVLKGIKVSSL